jgi:hypothetical protein
MEKITPAQAQGHRQSKARIVEALFIDSRRFGVKLWHVNINHTNNKYEA